MNGYDPVAIGLDDTLGTDEVASEAVDLLRSVARAICNEFSDDCRYPDCGDGHELCGNIDAAALAAIRACVQTVGKA